MLGYYLHKLFTPKWFSTFLLVVFLTQFVWIEGYGVSYFKVGVMAICPIVLMVNGLRFSKAMGLAFIYYIYILISASFHPDSFRFSTIGYLGLFLMMYVTFYNFVQAGALSLSYFIKFTRYMIYAFGICLVCQQVCMLVGIRFMPIVNLNNQFFLSLTKLPSLCLEPSHSARILGVLFYAYLKCNEYHQGRKVLLAELFSGEHMKVTILFLWAMMTMGSGTAFIALAVLTLYFMKGFQLLLSIPIFVMLYFILNFFQVEQFQRARKVAVAASTLDTNQVMEADGSAAVRIKPFLNTLSLDITKSETWFGKGCDSANAHGLYGNDRYLGEISDYGLIAYILGLAITFSCAISFLSLPTLMFFMGIGGGTGNIAYGWGTLMIFTCVRYFRFNHRESEESVENVEKDETSRELG